MIGIREACLHLTTTTDKHIIIWTDSESSIQAVSATTIRSRTVRDCHDALNNLGTANTVELRWVAAHKGIWGNERADELAKLGTTAESILRCPIPQSYIKKLIDDKVSRLNHEEWKKNGPRHTKMILGKNHAKPIHNLNTSLINNRLNYRTAVHLITGHCGLIHFRGFDGL